MIGVDRDFIVKHVDRMNMEDFSDDCGAVRRARMLVSCVSGVEGHLILRVEDHVCYENFKCFSKIADLRFTHRNNKLYLLIILHQH